MRIALVNTFSPFIRGGAEILVDDLAEQLKDHGHNVDLFRIPFPKYYEAPLITTIEAARMLHFDEFERVITFKFPAYCIKHHEKVIWMFHQFRQVYELFGSEYGLEKNSKGESIRKVVKHVDDDDIRQSKRVYTNAQEVTNRLMLFNKIPSIVLPPPLKKQELYYSENVGDYIYYPSRITDMKRQHLAIEAMRYVKSGVRLVVTGVSEGAYFKSLKQIINDYGLEKRVDIKDGWVDDDEKRSLLANSLGVIYIPFKEDSCGFVTMEAFYSAKPVITCTDSGGTGEFVENGVNGFIVEPSADAISKVMDILYYDKKLAEGLGRAGLEEITRRDITWPSTIQRLLQ